MVHGAAFARDPDILAPAPNAVQGCGCFLTERHCNRDRRPAFLLVLPTDERAEVAHSPHCIWAFDPKVHEIGLVVRTKRRTRSPPVGAVPLQDGVKENFILVEMSLIHALASGVLMAGSMWCPVRTSSAVKARNRCRTKFTQESVRVGIRSELPTYSYTGQSLPDISA